MKAARPAQKICRDAIKSLIDRRISIAFGSALAILIFVAAFSYRSMVVSGNSDGSVLHTRDVLESLQELLFATVSVQWSLSEFVLTGEDHLLEAYRANAVSVKQREAAIRELTLDNPVQQRLLPQIEGLTVQQLQLAENVIGLSRTEGLWVAVDAIRAHGQQSMGEFQAVVRLMQNEELRLLAQRSAEARRHSDQTKAVVIFGTALGLLITAGAGWSVQRGNFRRQLAEAALSESEIHLAELEDAQTHLAQKAEELNRSNEELEQFASIASHDLQEPLRMVVSYMQLLSRRYTGKLDSDADEFIAFAVDGANRMQHLIQDLLEYSRVGTTGNELVDTSSEAALDQSLMNLRRAIEESGALVTHDPLPDVLADEGQLIQLFQNLVGNAIKYQGLGVPLVHVSAAEDGGKKWMSSVTDNGLGIDPKYFERIFGMFQRLHKRDEFGGTGIGLAICKKIVERHGGNISVESQLGHGSTFRFALAES